jgi:hypothetical protein
MCLDSPFVFLRFDMQLSVYRDSTVREMGRDLLPTPNVASLSKLGPRPRCTWLLIARQQPIEYFHEPEIRSGRVHPREKHDVR